MNTPFDPWPWRRRVLATAAAAAALTVVVAALVATPPDAPPGLGSPAADVSVNGSSAAPLAGGGAVVPGGSPSPSPSGSSSSEPGRTGGDGSGTDGGGDDGKPVDGPPQQPAHVTGVDVTGVYFVDCGATDGCSVAADVRVTAYDTRGVSVSVTIAGSDGTAASTYTYQLSGSGSYTVTAPGSKGRYLRSTACTGSVSGIAVSASGSGRSNRGSLSCTKTRP